MSEKTSRISPYVKSQNHSDESQLVEVTLIFQAPVERL
jgi:hypothetical protein